MQYKKILLICGLLLLPSVSFGANAVSITPNQGRHNELLENFVVSCETDSPTATITYFVPPYTEFTAVMWGTCAQMQTFFEPATTLTWESMGSGNVEQEETLKAVICDGEGQDCDAGASYADVLNSPFFIADIGTVFTILSNTETESAGVVLGNTAFAGAGTTLGSALSENLPKIFLILGALLGLGFLVRYVKKQISRK